MFPRTKSDAFTSLLLSIMLFTRFQYRSTYSTQSYDYFIRHSDNLYQFVQVAFHISDIFHTTKSRFIVNTSVEKIFTFLKILKYF